MVYIKSAGTPAGAHVEGGDTAETHRSNAHGGLQNVVGGACRHLSSWEGRRGLIGKVIETIPWMRRLKKWLEK